MPSELLKSVRRLSNLERSWQIIQQNGRHSKSETTRNEIAKFSEDASHNLRSLQRRLVSGSFKFVKARGVRIPKYDGKGKRIGKFRSIVLAPIESRIVQRAILNVLVEIDTLKPYVKTPYSFGGIRSERERGVQRRSDHLSAVPAAIQAILTEIKHGAKYVVSADITAFFTRISKDYVLNIIQSATLDNDFIAFLRKAINVELENMTELRNSESDFPIEDIGVAQGSSLSPLLGNIALAEFDRVMNDGDCRCIRYIDDFIIMAPTIKAANARLEKARRLLSALTMELSPEKSMRGGFPVAEGFDFLGITISSGLIRPTRNAQERFLSSLTKVIETSQKAMIGVKTGHAIQREVTLITTLKRVDGMIDGWGKHYWFCNDRVVLVGMDAKISECIRTYLGTYGSIRDELDHKQRASIFGLAQLALLERDPFIYPSVDDQSRQALCGR